MTTETAIPPHHTDSVFPERDRQPRRPEGQAVLSIRGFVAGEDAPEFISNALRDVRAYMQEHHVPPSGPPFSISRVRGDALEVEAGWPTAKPVPGTSRIHCGSMPPTLIRKRAVV
jgi:hypothetical protein